MNTCLCGHSPDHHSRNAAGPQAGRCLASLCGCMWWRPDPKTAVMPGTDCRLPCDADCEIAAVHCWNHHRPNHKPDWHDPDRCDEAAAREAG